MKDLKKLEDYKFVEGEVLLFEKPYAWTSFDLVNKVRKNICMAIDQKKLKVGHAGTLDPLATGLLIVCTGKSTKIIDSFQGQEKEYLATLKLGATTPSFDLETEIDQTFPFEHIDLEMVKLTIQEHFIGELMQIPPAYSAVKVKGKRAYDMARAGQEVILAPKKLVIKEIEIVSFTPPEMALRIVCSKGTYIRGLARDIGKALNTGAHLTGLIRTRIGDSCNKDALDVEKFIETLKKM